MTSTIYPITPDFCPTPGETILEVIEDLDISKTDLAIRTGLSVKTISQLINGKISLTSRIADKLEYVTNIPCSFWINLENNYRVHIKQKKEREQKSIEKAREFVSGFPYTNLVKKGLCPDTKDPVNKKDALLRFFAVSGESEFESAYITRISGAARVGQSKKWNAKAFATWLRLTELAAQKIPTSNFDKEKLKTTIKQIRCLISPSPQKNWAKITELLAEAGVAAVVVPELTGTHIAGFSRFIEPNRAILAVSLRGQRVGSFWFNVFHELGHLLLHSKKKTFYNFDDQPQSTNLGESDLTEEKEADEYSRNVLIPYSAWGVFIKNRRQITPFSVQTLSTKLNIPTDVVLGRLQREGIVSYSNPIFQGCRQKLQWE